MFYYIGIWYKYLGNEMKNKMLNKKREIKEKGQYISKYFVVYKTCIFVSKKVRYVFKARNI